MQETKYQSILGLKNEDAIGIELVGRADEFQTLINWLSSNQNILIFGEPGIGKTRLIYDLLETDFNKDVLFLPSNMTVKDGLSSILEQCYDSIGLDTKTLYHLSSLWTVSKNVSSMIIHGQHLSWAKLANGISRMDVSKKKQLLFKSLENQKLVLVLVDAKDLTPTIISFLIELMEYCQILVSLPTSATKHKKFQRLIQLFSLQIELNSLSVSDSKILIKNFIKDKAIIFENDFDQRAAVDYIASKSDGVPRKLLDLLQLLAEKNLNFDDVYNIESDSGGIVVCLTPFILLAGFIGIGYSRVLRYMGTNPEYVVWALIIGLVFFGLGYLLRGK